MVAEDIQDVEAGGRADLSAHTGADWVTIVNVFNDCDKNHPVDIEEDSFRMHISPVSNLCSKPILILTTENGGILTDLDDSNRLRLIIRSEDTADLKFKGSKREYAYDLVIVRYPGTVLEYTRVLMGGAFTFIKSVSRV